MNAANTADLYQMVGSQRPVRGRMRKSKKACRSAKASLEAEAFHRAKPCRRRTLRLGRRPTVQLQSTGRHTRLHPYILLDTAYLSLTVSISYSLCVCLCLSLTQTLTHRKAKRQKQ